MKIVRRLVEVFTVLAVRECGVGNCQIEYIAILFLEF